MWFTIPDKPYGYQNMIRRSAINPPARWVAIGLGGNRVPIDDLRERIIVVTGAGAGIVVLLGLLVGVVRDPRL